MLVLYPSEARPLWGSVYLGCPICVLGVGPNPRVTPGARLCYIDVALSSGLFCSSIWLLSFC